MIQVRSGQTRIQRAGGLKLVDKIEEIFLLQLLLMLFLLFAQIPSVFPVLKKYFKKDIK
jgi:hypothetical protein